MSRVYKMLPVPADVDTTCHCRSC